MEHQLAEGSIRTAGRPTAQHGGVISFLLTPVSPGVGQDTGGITGVAAGGDSDVAGAAGL
jgi:hypothetical protein